MKQSRQFWVEHVEAASRSGVALVRYAKQANVPLKALYNWRSKLAKQGELALRSGASVSERFVAVRVTPAAATNHPWSAANLRCQLVVAPGISLELLALPDPSWLVALQRAAQGAR